MKSAALDPDLNKAPDTVRHVHVMGVCGTGMAALAGMLQDSGLKVTGSDANVYPPMSDFLAGAGIAVLEGYRPENLEPRPDLVIVGNVIRAVNPEAVALAAAGIPYLSMPQALGHFFLQTRKSMVVAGTHGKTTTSSLLATSMHYCGGTPGFLIGGLVEAFGRNYNLSDAPWFVIEGDEYDTAFFNKVSKFLHYRPFNAILTSIEFDHADIFPDLEAIKDSFRRFVQLLPKKGCLVACYDDSLVREISQQAQCPVISYGTDPACKFQVVDIKADGLQTSFTLLRHKKEFGRFVLPMPGLHNVLNASAVIALMDHIDFSVQDVTNALVQFKGVKRRQQVRGEVNGITVIDDFAHHPTAVKATIQALRAAYPEHRLVVVFEPRTNTSRRAIFQKQYVHSFSGADMVLVREHVPLDTVAVNEQFSSRRLVDDLKNQSIPAAYYADTDAILDALQENARSGDVIAVLSNGGFDNIHSRLLTLLAAQ